MVCLPFNGCFMYGTRYETLLLVSRNHRVLIPCFACVLSLISKGSGPSQTRAGDDCVLQLGRFARGAISGHRYVSIRMAELNLRNRTDNPASVRSLFDSEVGDSRLVSHSCRNQQRASNLSLIPGFMLIFTQETPYYLKSKAVIYVSLWFAAGM